MFVDAASSTPGLTLFSKFVIILVFECSIADTRLKSELIIVLGKKVSAICFITEDGFQPRNAEFPKACEINNSQSLDKHALEISTTC